MGGSWDPPRWELLMENTTEPLLSQRDQLWIGGKDGARKEGGKKAKQEKKKFHKNREWELCAALALVESSGKRRIGKSRVWRKLGTNKVDNRMTGSR